LYREVRERQSRSGAGSTKKIQERQAEFQGTICALIDQFIGSEGRSLPRLATERLEGLCGKIVDDVAKPWLSALEPRAIAANACSAQEKFQFRPGSEPSLGRLLSAQSCRSRTPMPDKLRNLISAIGMELRKFIEQKISIVLSEYVV